MKLKVYRVFLLISLFAIIALSIVFAVLSIVHSTQNKGDVFDAIMYVVCFLIIIAFSTLQIINTFVSMKSDNSFLKNLLYESDGQLIRGLYIGVYILLGVGIFVIFYSSLLFANLPIPFKDFDLPIKYVLFDFGVLIALNSLFTLIFPSINK